MSEQPPQAADAPKAYQDILAQEIREGLRELDRSATSLFLSAVSAGLDLGFSLLAIAAILTLVDGQSELVQQLLIAKRGHLRRVHRHRWSGTRDLRNGRSR